MLRTLPTLLLLGLVVATVWTWALAGPEQRPPLVIPPAPAEPVTVPTRHPGPVRAIIEDYVDGTCTIIIPEGEEPQMSGNRCRDRDRP